MLGVCYWGGVRGIRKLIEVLLEGNIGFGGNCVWWGGERVGWVEKMCYYEWDWV